MACPLVLLINIPAGGHFGLIAAGAATTLRSAGCRLSAHALQNQPLPDSLPGDAVIARIRTTEQTRQLQQRHQPVVNVSSNDETCPFPVVASDDVAIGRMAAQHFLAQGYRRFAYCGDQSWFARRRLAGYKAALSADAAFFTADLEAPAGKMAVMADLVDWVRTSTQRVGLLCANDGTADLVQNRLLDAGVSVPAQVAILGVDDDPNVAMVAQQPLSSIAHAAFGIGVRAAECVLADLGLRPDPGTPLRLPPSRIIVRSSSDALACADPSVVAAQAWIDAHITDDLDVDTVARAVGLPRRTLERRFHAQLGGGVASSIRRSRMQTAQTLLTTTELPLGRIAQLAGYASLSYMAGCLRRHTGLTPSQFRDSCRVWT